MLRVSLYEILKAGLSSLESLEPFSHSKVGKVDLTTPASYPYLEQYILSLTRNIASTVDCSNVACMTHVVIHVGTGRPAPLME